MSKHEPTPAPLPGDPETRPHVYDGIQEFDNKLPNWWLHTLYWAIAFSVVYWIYHEQSSLVASDERQVQVAVAEIERARLASVDLSDNGKLWAMTTNPDFLASGKALFDQNCAACHGLDLKGGVGVSLVDATWVHGGKPSDLFKTINDGVLAKGMPAWGALLGPQKILQIQAYILSHHTPNQDQVATPKGAQTAAAK
jgi:cytochrome c oxidase cbb3-type subunit 3